MVNGISAHRMGLGLAMLVASRAGLIHGEEMMARPYEEAAPRREEPSGAPLPRLARQAARGSYERDLAAMSAAEAKRARRQSKRASQSKSGG